jgi:hypothetical protein
VTLVISKNQWRSTGGQAEISMIWCFFLNHAPQECLRPKILNYGPIGIS